MESLTSIPEFFAKRSVFITGGTGFVGKVLVEKLLRSCPDVKTVFLLVRPKKGKTIEERIQQIINTPLFDKLRETDPGAVKKIIPLLGDASENSLGLAEEDRQRIINEVSVIIHSAASVRFDDSLQDAMFKNVRSTREAAQIALETKNIAAFLHVSTTYCQIDKFIVEEQIYPSYGHWKEAIEVAEKCEQSVLEAFSTKYIEPFPNTYTYTKLLAEHVVNDMCVGKIPAIIYRPSVVISSSDEPFQGWLDNFNGPTGLLVAGGKGILRTVYGNRKINTDYVCVDITVKAMLVTIWNKAINKDTSQVSVYNGSKYKTCPIQLGELVDLGKRLYWDVPFENKLWFPRNEMTDNWYNYYFNVILFHVFPGILIDIILRIVGQKPFLFRIQRKIYIANMAVSYFMMHQWDFVNTRLWELSRKIPDSDKEAFFFDQYSDITEETYDFFRNSVVYEFYKVSCDFARRYLLKEVRDIKPQTFTNTRRLYFLDCAVRILFFAGLIWFVGFKLDLIFKASQVICAYWNGL